MRLVVGALVWLSVGAISPALADPPADPAATQTSPAPAAATSAPAAPAATAAPAAAAADAHPAASAAAPAANRAPVEISAAEMDKLEKHFLAEGYKVEMHNGQKYFCRREEELGSRLGGHKDCHSADQLQFIESDSARQVGDAQRAQRNSSPGR